MTTYYEDYFSVEILGQDCTSLYEAQIANITNNIDFLISESADPLLIDEAMEDIKHGRVYHAEGVEEMFKQILG